MGITQLPNWNVPSYSWNLADPNARQDFRSFFDYDGDAASVTKGLWVEGVSSGIGLLRFEWDYGGDNSISKEIKINVLSSKTVVNQAVRFSPANANIDYLELNQLMKTNQVRRYEGPGDHILGLAVTTVDWDVDSAQNASSYNNLSMPSMVIALLEHMRDSNIDVYVVSSYFGGDGVASTTLGRYVVKRGARAGTWAHEYAHIRGESHVCDGNNFMWGTPLSDGTPCGVARQSESFVTAAQRQRLIPQNP